MGDPNSTNRFGNIVRTASTCLIFVAALCVPVSRAQESPEQTGLDQGNYNIRQSIEIGGRFTSISGDPQAYDTFVNLQSGARLLGFTTEMRSLDHHATMFDRLYLSSFGYGGDPNQASRLRLSKNKLYNFDASFRRDENTWGYSLLANPLNPATPIPNAPANFNPQVNAPLNVVNTPLAGLSPHLYDTRRNLGNYDFVAMPDSPLRLRLGFTHNTVYGPFFSTIHQGTEQALLGNYSTTVNSYRLGVDFKFVPRTNFSYDQIWNYFKNDSGYIDANQQFSVGAGVPLVDLGVSFNAGANQPCANTFTAAHLVNPTCSAYFTYDNTQRLRTNTPTEQFSMQSNYWKSWDFSARVSYSAGDLNVYGYNQNIFGRESRTNLRNFDMTGPIQGRRVAGSADGGATWHITNKLNFIDTFHYLNFHNPAQFAADSCSFFSPNLLTAARVFAPTAATPFTCAAPAGTIAGTPLHSTSSLADVSVITNSNFFKEDEKINVAELEYQFTPKYGARVGFRYRHQAIDDNFLTLANETFFPNNAARGACALVNPAQPLSQANLPDGCTLNSDGSIGFVMPPSGLPYSAGLGETFIDQYAGLFGFWARPISNWQIRFDLELMSADNAFTRISPRQSQEYRLRSKYKVADWLNLNGSVMIWEGRNNIVQTNDLQHNRAYGIGAILQPTERLGMEIGYDYNDVFSQVLICYVSIVGGQAPPGVAACPNVPGLVQQLSTYHQNSNYGYFDFTYTPQQRVTLRFGANLTGTGGSELRLDPQALIPSAVDGTLNSVWYHPFGGVDYRFSKNWTGRAYWDYYGYHEDPTFGAVQDIFAPRNFRANLVTLSLRYAF
jgi:hypothetical protein